MPQLIGEQKLALHRKQNTTQFEYWILGFDYKSTELPVNLPFRLISYSDAAF